MNMRSIKCTIILVVIVALQIDANTGDFVGKKELSLIDSSILTAQVGITVLQSAVAKGAVCLDGSPPAYHLQRGFGSGANSWIVHLEGGGWCNDIQSCSDRARTALGSSLHMEKTTLFAGVLSNLQSENPDFYNSNRVLIRYCDGSSFTGDVDKVDPGNNLYFRGQRIWQAVIEDLLAKGMDKAQQALLTGCSAGGLATFIHCDQFRGLLPSSAQVKCMADAGFFLDSKDVAGLKAFRSFNDQIVTLHGSLKHLPAACTSKLAPASLCFFPQYLLRLIQTPLFVVNSAYDPLQIGNILVPAIADPNNKWQNCKRNITTCVPWQLKILEGFRNEMISDLTHVATSTTGGLFINSCYAHCQTNVQVLWHAPQSPKLKSKTIAEAVGDWIFQRRVVKDIDCPFPCDSTCNNDFYH